MKKINVKENDYKFVINKEFYLDSDYYPNDLCLINPRYSINNQLLRKEAKDAFEKMARSAGNENLFIKAVSTFRSYNYQDELYNEYVYKYGKDYADECSAKAGHSEHQTGLAVDVADKTGDYDNFDKTDEFLWMRKNADKYGFILRYPKDKTHITKYKYEPWHYRYVGSIASKIKNANISLEEEKDLF